MIRVILPYHLRTLAQTIGDAELYLVRKCIRKALADRLANTRNLLEA